MALRNQEETLKSTQRAQVLLSEMTGTLKFLQALKIVLKMGFTNPDDLHAAAENFTLTVILSKI